MPEPGTEAETVFKDEWQEYQQEQAAEKKKRALILNRKKDALQRWEKARKVRQQGMIRKLSPYGLSLLNLGRHILKEQQTQEKRNFRLALESQGRPCIETQSFRLWLARDGSRKSILWRLRKRLIPGVPIEKFTFSKLLTSAPIMKGICKRLKRNSVNTQMVLG